MRATIAAIAIIAMVLATAAHEAIGHGAACLLAGGHITQLTSVYFQCSAGSAWIPAGGPLGNLGAAVLGLVALALLPKTSVRARLLALLLTAFSLFWFAGYLVYAMALNEGDYIFALRAAIGEATPLWRLVLGLAGLSLFLRAARIIGHLLGREGMAHRGLTATAWLAATGAAVVAALFYSPDRGGAAVQALLEIGAASLPLLLLQRPAPADAGMAPSPAWIGTSALLFAVFVLTLGRGLP